jgi:hypothetical protein
MSNGGPHLSVAVLCEKVLQEITGTISVIRIIDRVTVSAQGARAPETMPAFPIRLTALLLFRSGEAKGSYTVALQPVAPSGIRPQGVSAQMLLEGEDRGAQLIFDINFNATEEGVYWFDVSVNSELITRIPLRVVYQRVAMSQSGATPIH